MIGLFCIKVEQVEWFQASICVKRTRPKEKPEPLPRPSAPAGRIACQPMDRSIDLGAGHRHGSVRVKQVATRQRPDRI